MKEKTLVIIIKQRKTSETGGTITTTEQIGDRELIKHLKESFLRELLEKLTN